MMGIAVIFHDWLGSGTPCALYGLADNATRQVTGLYLCHDECIKGYIEVLRQTVTNHGIPLGLHAENSETLFGGDSPLGAIIGDRLGIDLIAAPDAQHLKRVGYLWKALRNHFPRWLRILSISDMGRINRELHHYMAVFNERFAKEPQSPESYFVPLGVQHDLDLLLSVRHETVTDAMGRFFFNEFVFSVDSEQPFAHKRIEFLFGEGVGFLACCDGKYHKVSFHESKHKDRIVRPSTVLKTLVREIYYTKLDKLWETTVFNKEIFPH